MAPGEAVNRINKIFEEAVHLYRGDVKKVLNHVRTRIGAASGEERADISRVFERVVAFCAPTGCPQSLN